MYVFMKSHQRSLLMSLLGCCVYGSWALWVNFDAGSWLALKASAVQGLCSFALTWVVTMFMEGALARVQLSPAWAQGLVAGLLGVLLMILVQVAGHVVAHTPKLLATIAPCAIFGSIYCLVYSQRRAHQGKSHVP